MAMVTTTNDDDAGEVESDHAIATETVTVGIFPVTAAAKLKSLPQLPLMAQGSGGRHFA